MTPAAELQVPATRNAGALSHVARPIDRGQTAGLGIDAWFDSIMPIELSSLDSPSPAALPVEIVERKGLGHPDTICDALAEELSLALSRFYLERFGAILHHNVDKALLWGGRSRPAFGGGEVLEPIEIYPRRPRDRGSRAAYACRSRSWPSRQPRAGCARTCAHLDPARHVRIHSLIRPSSPRSRRALRARARGRAARERHLVRRRLRAARSARARGARRRAAAERARDEGGASRDRRGREGDGRAHGRSDSAHGRLRPRGPARRATSPTTTRRRRASRALAHAARARGAAAEVEVEVNAADGDPAAAST